MTPEQATLAAGILSMHLPSDPGRMADMLAVIEELRALSAQPCAWRYEAGTLRVTNTEGHTRILARVPGIACEAGRALASPGEWVVASTELSRDALKDQRRRLAKRLADMNLHTLAEAVRSIRLRADGATVRCCYDPLGLPVRFG